jgi:hypothetical protein
MRWRAACAASADQVRVNAQLVDTETGGHLWAERFEGEVARLAELQSEITGRIARSLDLELTDIESERARRERPDNPDAVDLTFRGWAAVNAPDTRENMAAAIGFFERALAIDPDHVNALVGLSLALSENAISQFSSDPGADLGRADAAIAKAVAASPRNAEAYFAKGNVLQARKQFDDAAVAFDRAVALNPNLAPAFVAKAINEVFSGRSAEAFALVDKATRLSPPRIPTFPIGFSPNATPTRISGSTTRPSRNAANPWRSVRTGTPTST